MAIWIFLYAIHKPSSKHTLTPSISTKASIWLMKFINNQTFSHTTTISIYVQSSFFERILHFWINNNIHIDCRQRAKHQIVRTSSMFEQWQNPFNILQYVFIKCVTWSLFYVGDENLLDVDLKKYLYDTQFTDKSNLLITMKSLSISIFIHTHTLQLISDVDISFHNNDVGSLHSSFSSLKSWITKAHDSFLFFLIFPRLW